MSALRKTTLSLLACCALLPLLGCGKEPHGVTAPNVQVAGGAVPWSVFGDATAVRQLAAPNPWAVQLRSQASGPGFGGIDFQPRTPPTFAQLTALSADFNVTDDDCGGGSPRFQLNMDTNGDGAAEGNIFVAFGPSPNFTGCTGDWETTGNLIGNNEHGRYDASQVGGSTFGTYQDAVAVAGAARVLGIQLVVDGSWFFADDDEQTVLVDNVRVNEHRLTARGFLP